MVFFSLACFGTLNYVGAIGSRLNQTRTKSVTPGISLVRCPCNAIPPHNYIQRFVSDSKVGVIALTRCFNL